MADIYSTDMQVWVDLLNKNWQNIQTAIADRTRTPSQLELVETLKDTHTLLVNLREEGVDKIQRASSSAIVNQISADLDRLIRRVEAFLAQAQEDEQTRLNNETTRQTNESGRVTAENGRVSAESGRVTAENTRIGNETDRQTAETTRVTNWNNFFGATADAGVRRTWSDWFSDTLATGVRKLWNDFWSTINSNWQGFWGTSESDPNGVRKQWTDLHTQAGNDHTQATNDHTASVTATNEASNVNAQLSGFTVTITNRNGQSSSVDIGFEIYRTYASVALMNADAENVPQGKFVVIATVSPTDPDNAKMYCKNSQGSFTFLCDLDQASAEAWAEWLNEQKPLIEAAIAQAATDHTRAEGDHTTAGTDHTQASTDHSTATSDHSTAQSDHTQSVTDSAYARNQGDYAKNMADHPAYIGEDNYWYIWDYDTQAYVKDAYAKGDDLHWDEMTPQEKDDLEEKVAEKVAEEVVYATVEQSIAAAEELT